MFSQRTNWPLSSNRIARTVNTLRHDGVAVIDLTESNPTRCGFDYPSQNILSPLSSPANLRYDPNPQGSLPAREAVCRYYKNQGRKVPVERVFLTASTSEAYSYLFRLLVDPGQEVLFPRPSYPLFQFLGDLNDVVLRHYPLIYTDRWQIDGQALAEAAGPQAKAVVLVNPNNPTGSFVRKDELVMFNELCRKKNMALICDEVFWDFTFADGNEHISLVDNDGALTFVLGGLSKTLGLPQMKLGWIIVSGPEELANTACRRLEVIADTYLSVNTPVQNAAAHWLSLKEELQGQIRERIRNNRKFLEETTRGASGCRLLNADGGWYAVMRISTASSEEEMVCALLEKDHVFVHPGYFFDFAEEAFVVVSLLPREETFREGVRRLLSRLTAG